MKNKNYRTFNNLLSEELSDPGSASMYLQIALEEFEKDKDTKAFLTSLRNIAEAQGGLTRLSKKASLNRQNLYKALSGRGNPKLDTLLTILNCIGLRLAVLPKAKKI